jgi:hypothetical protein
VIDVVAHGSERLSTMPVRLLGRSRGLPEAPSWPGRLDFLRRCGRGSVSYVAVMCGAFSLVLGPGALADGVV